MRNIFLEKSYTKYGGAETYASFWKMLLNFIRPIGHSTHKISDPLRIKLLTRLRLGFSHLSEHKFKYNFADSLSPLCSCSLETESTLLFFLYAAKITLLYAGPLWLFKKNINVFECKWLRVILHGNKNFDNNMNISIPTATINFNFY